MTNAKTEPAKKPETGELSEAALSQASGGALNAYMPAESAHGTGGGGGAGKAIIAVCDGSVRTATP